MDFSGIFLFDGIESKDCLAMMKCFDVKTKHFSKGQIICDFTIPNDTVYIMNEGRAELVREDADGNRTVLEYLSAKSVFGEMLAFSKVGNNNVFAVCDEKCEILFIAYDQITKRCSNACLHHTRLVENLFSLVSRKAMDLSERVEILSMRTIRGRLMCCFSIFSSKNAGKNIFMLPFSITELAEYICVDRSALTREMAKMKKEGILDIQKRQVTLHTWL